jgi:hypothetical protein
MFEPQKHVLNKENVFKTMILLFKTKYNVLFFCFLPSKHHGFALGHLQAGFYPGVATPNFKTWYLRIKTRGLVVLET